MQVNTDAASKSLTNATYQQLLLSHLQEGRNHMDNQETHRYDDIIKLPHPTSKTHPRMPLYNRATQFSPFAALAGYDDALRETARRTDRFVELDEDRKQELDRQISYLQQHLLDTVPVKIIYFVPNEKKGGGSYTAVEGCVRKIDENTKSLRIQGTEIPVERIYGIDFL